MTIETEFYSYRNSRRGRFHGDMSIKPGSAEIITHLKPTDVLVVLNIDNTKGEIRIKNPNRVRVVKYRSGTDRIGIRVDPAEPIQMTVGEEIQLIKRDRKKSMRKFSKVVYFWIEPNDDSYEKIPDPDEQTRILI